MPHISFLPFFHPSFMTTNIIFSLISKRTTAFAIQKVNPDREDSLIAALYYVVIKNGFLCVTGINWLQ